MAWIEKFNSLSICTLLLVLIHGKKSIGRIFVVFCHIVDFCIGKDILIGQFKINISIFMWLKAGFCFSFFLVTSRRSAVILRSCPQWPCEAARRQGGECTTPEVKGTAVCKVLSTGWQKGRGVLGFKLCPLYNRNFRNEVTDSWQQLWFYNHILVTNETLLSTLSNSFEILICCFSLLVFVDKVWYFNSGLIKMQLFSVFCRSLVEEFRKTLCSLWQGSQTAFSPDALFYVIWKIMPSFRYLIIIQVCWIFFPWIF